MRKGVLLVNLGTPDSFQRKDVKKYLAEFLMDGRVIDIPFIKRFLLVRGIIAPFRSKKVSIEYKKLWLDSGSPLMVYGRQLADKPQKKYTEAHEDVRVELVMRYQQPSIKSGLEKLKKAGVQQVVVMPLFPQYASATVGSVAQRVMEIMSKWEVIPSLSFINDYHNHPDYINVFADKVRQDIKKHQPDHVLFSYHGIPVRHLENIKKQSPALCAYPQCACNKAPEKHSLCYRSACFNTSRLLIEKIDRKEMQFSTSFQSRLGKTPWIQPYTDDTIERLAKEGTQNLLVVSPSFVADCLETTLEIGEQYKELFEHNGGKIFNFTESLNADDRWVNALYKIIEERSF